MTSALNKSDMKAVGLQMALDLLAKKEKKDSITGLRTRTKPGRPDWKQVGLSSKLHLKTCSLVVAQSSSKLVSHLGEIPSFYGQTPLSGLSK